MTDWDARYRRGDYLSEEPHPLLVKFASTLLPARALDIACGAGRHALWLAERGWCVTAVDYSKTAIAILEGRALERGLSIDCRKADLEKHEFVIPPESYELIVVINYLQRDLLPSIKAGLAPAGTAIIVIALVDDNPNVKPMNPAYLLNPGELRAHFRDWERIYDFEGKPGGSASRRAAAELVVRRPG